MDWKTHRAELLKDPEVQKALKDSELEFQIAKAVIAARLERGLTQRQLAEKLHTKQSVISRVENANTTPSISFLKRLSHVLGVTLQVQFKF